MSILGRPGNLPTVRQSLPSKARDKKHLTLILGGARSGKSRYGQELAGKFERVVCLVTARPTDSEMRRKIAVHRLARPSHWQTVEAPENLDQAIRRAETGADVLLIDCLTVYVANALEQNNGRVADCEDLIQRTCQAIRNSKAPVIVVSNEVGSGVVPEYRSGRLYRDLLGQFNQRVAQIADQVILMVAGLPIIVKDGTKPGRE